MNQTTTAPLPGREALLRWNAATGTLRGRSYRIDVIGGPSHGRAIALDRTVRVGSHPDAELTVADGTVSRLHVELTPRSDGVRVRDLGSRNGTYISGARVSEVILEAEATLTVGMTRLRVCAEETDLGTPEKLAQFGTVVGAGPRMQSLLGLLSRVARSDATVLLEGETGTGKEVIAHALHAASGRAAGPLVVIDCSAIPSELSESQLFGHVKGAFTGAVSARRGAFADAHGGTVFLDEIGELPLDLQPRLLRVLETGCVRPVGGDETRSVDIRVIAATHRNLERQVAEGRFREDLFYRLSVVSLSIPPLRERIEDLPLLVGHFAARAGAPGAVFGPRFLAALCRHAWPGNVRELRNVVERALVLHPGVASLETLSDADVARLISSASTGAASGESSSSYVEDEGAPAAADASTPDDEKTRIIDALARSGGNQSVAARLLGISRGTLIARIRAYDLPRPRKGSV